MTLSKEDIAEIKRLSKQGKSTKEIACALCISCPSARKYAGNAKTRKQVEREGLISLLKRNPEKAIIDFCHDEYGLELSKSAGFLKRQRLLYLQNKRKHIFAYFNHAADYFIIFNYLTGRIPVTAGNRAYKDVKENIYDARIESLDDLYLLRKSEIGSMAGTSYASAETAEKKSAKRTDNNLVRLVDRVNSRANKYKLNTWKEQLDELGEDKEVLKHLTKDKKAAYEFERRYNVEIGLTPLSILIKKCWSPNPLTYSHGGKRR